MLPLAREHAPPGDERKLGAPFDYGSGPIRVIWGPQDDYFSAKEPQTNLHRIRIQGLAKEAGSHGHPPRRAG